MDKRRVRPSAHGAIIPRLATRRAPSPHASEVRGRSVDYRRFFTLIFLAETRAQLGGDFRLLAARSGSRIQSNTRSILSSIVGFEKYSDRSSQRVSEILELFLTIFKKWDILDSKEMKTLEIFRREPRMKKLEEDSQIRIYRSHAARAISEERWDVAEIFLDRILKVDARHTEAWLMKGHLRQHCREDEQAAVDCYRKVITLCGHDSVHPHAKKARTSLGRLLAVWS
jgi:hypothetical protein